MVNTYAQQPRRLALYGAIGALVSLLSYLLLPFISVTLSAASSSSYGSSSPSYTQTVSLGAGVIALFVSPISLEALFAVAVLCLAALFMLREVPFGQGSVPVTVQMRRGGYAIAALGLIAVVFQFLLITIANGQVSQALQSASIGSTSLYELLARTGATISISFGYAVGSWIYLLGMLAVAGCGWFLARAGQPTGMFMAAPQGSSASLPPMQPSQPLWQQPAQSSQPLWQQPMQPSQPLWQPQDQVYPAQSQPVMRRQTQQFSQDVPQPTPPYMQPQVHPWQQPPASNSGDGYPTQGSY